MTIESPNHWWQNWSKTHAYVAQRMFFPKSVGEIAEAIRTSEANERPLRAVGGGWSFSDAALPGSVSTNRPNVYAVDALSAVVPRATHFPADLSTVSTASIEGNTPTTDEQDSMVMLNSPEGVSAFVDPDWSYRGQGQWKYQEQSYGRNVDPTHLLDFLARTTWRPIHNPNLPRPQCVEESDGAGSLVMFDLEKNPTKPSRDWFYNGNGFWTVGVAGDSVPNHGTLYTLAGDKRLKSYDQFVYMNLSPRAARAGEGLSLLLSKQTTVPTETEPVFLINTRSLVSSLQQHLPSILSDAARDATSNLPTNGEPQRFLFHVEAGITIAELGQLLAHQSPRLSLQAISGSPGATLAGALATGTHGAEFNWPLLVDTVKAVHLVGPGGLQWWIEGDESIADPQKLQVAFPQIASERFISRATAQGGIVGQDWLNAVVVSMGSIGVLYSVVLEVVPLFGVHEVVVQTTWRNLPSPGARGQADWRWCHKCKGLFYSERKPSVGSCPAGGQHEKGGSFNYTLAHDSPGTLGQADWRFCHKCNGLFYADGQPSVGSCPVGGQHENGGSFNYTLVHDSTTALGQADWRFCNKCKGLYYAEGQASAGSCPAGGQHQKGGSFNYTLTTDMTSLLRSPAISRDVSAYIVKLLQNGELNGTGIMKVNAQGYPVNRYADLAINPNRKEDGDFDIWIGNRELTPNVPLDPQPPAGNETADMINGISMALSSATDLDTKLTNIYGFRSLLDIIRHHPVGPDALPKIIADVNRTRQKFDSVTNSADLIDVALDTVLTPMVGNSDGPLLAQTFLTGVLSGLLSTANCDRRSNKIGVSVGALGFPESGIMGTALEIALSPADAFGFLQTEILDYADLNMGNNIPFFGYVSIRLCNMTKSLMGMQQFGDADNLCSVMIEVVAYGNPESRKFIQDLQMRTLAYINAGSLDAMLHWGLENEQLTGDHLRKTRALQKRTQSGMSKLSTFKAARAWLHTAAPTAFRVFDNNFTERLGLSVLDGLLFCDTQNTVINIWNPTAIGLHGFALRENERSRLDDLLVLNHFDHDVHVIAVRINSSGDDEAGAPVFEVASTLPFSINAGQSFWMEVWYNGTKQGPITGFVEVVCDDPINPTVRIPLMATVQPPPPPAFKFAPDSLNFGTTRVGTTVNRNLTMTNISDRDAGFTMMVTPDQGQFTVNGVYPASEQTYFLGTGQSGTMLVAYDPTTSGTADARLLIDMQDPTGHSQSRYAIKLQGEAQMPTLFLADGPQRWRTGPDGNPIPMRDLPLRVLDFGSAAPSRTSTASFWIRNNGDAPLTVNSVSSLHFPHDNFFAADTNVFPMIVPPGGEQVVPCVFIGGMIPGQPLGTEFKVVSDDPLQPSTGTVLLVTGRTAGPHLTRPTEFERGFILVTLPDPTSITFLSDGTAPVVVEKVKLTANSNFQVSTVPLVPVILQPGTALTVTITATQPGEVDQLFMEHDGTTPPNSEVQLRSE